MENAEKIMTKEISVLNFAYVGDASFGLLVKSLLVKQYDYKTNKINKMANSIVCAKAQAEIMREAKEMLTKTELDLIKRARNCHLSANRPKSCTLEEYSLATQLETLFGYWFMNNQLDRVKEFTKKYLVDRL